MKKIWISYVRRPRGGDTVGRQVVDHVARRPAGSREELRMKLVVLGQKK